MPDYVSNSPTTSRIVVTGATGYIGYALLQEIRENLLHSLTPIAVTRASSDTIRLHSLLDYLCAHETVLTADLNDVDSLRVAVEGADIIVHLAAKMDFFPKNAQALLSVNVEGTRNLLEASTLEAQSSKRPIRFVYVSSTEAIGPTNGLSKVDESHALNPDSHYGRSKMLAEEVVREYKDRLDVVIVRPTGVYGPDERFFFYELMQMAASGLTILVPSPMSGRVSFTHIKDVVRGILACATHPLATGNTYNLCADDSASYMSIVQKLSNVLKYPRPVGRLPLPVGVFLIRAVAPFMNIGKRRTFIYHAKTVRQTIQHREYSNDKLRSELGYAPKYTTLAGIEETLKYELEVGGIRRSAIPPCLKRCIQFAGLVIFTIKRCLGRAQRV